MSTPSAELVRLSPGSVTLNQLAAICEQGRAAALDDDARARIEASANLVANMARGDMAIYGVNTGFGKLASMRIPPDDVARLQRNLILSHCGGFGPPLPRDIVRLAMALKLISLGRGASGVRWELVELLQNMLIRGVVPVTPGQGSVGASGDLAPLAHMASVMLGEGEAEIRGERLPAAEALRRAELSPIALGPKEGLALVNGTQISTALALAGQLRAWRHGVSALAISALSIDALMGSSAPFHPQIHALRGHRGQIESARLIRALLAGSAIRDSHRDGDERVQDPYSLRCQPQVSGACLDVLRHTGSVLLTEANAATDNPLVFVKSGEIVSGGNFHAEPTALAADQIALALAEIGAIAQRRIAMMVDPALSYGLPAFLSPMPGLNSGFMLIEVTSAALMSENRQRAAPASIDSTPTSANQEDHVSMACHGARRLLDMADNLGGVLGIELLCAAQGAELRGPLKTSPALQAIIHRLREVSPALDDDRMLDGDVAAAAKLIEEGEIIRVLENIEPRPPLPAFDD